MKILVLASCGKRKGLSNPNAATLEVLSTKERIDDYLSSEVPKVPAGDLYTGPQAVALREAVKLLREKFPTDYYIISAGFGLVRDSDELPAYDVSFNDMPLADAMIRADMLGIRDGITKLPQYDLVLLAVGQRYSRVLGTQMQDSWEKGNTVVHFLRTHASSAVYLPLGAKEVSTLSQYFPIQGVVGSKGAVIREIAKGLNNHMKPSEIREWYVKLIKQTETDATRFQ